MKRWTSLLLALALVFSFAAPVLAADEEGLEAISLLEEADGSVDMPLIEEPAPGDESSDESADEGEEAGEPSSEEGEEDEAEDAELDLLPDAPPDSFEAERNDLAAQEAALSGEEKGQVARVEFHSDFAVADGATQDALGDDIVKRYLKIDATNFPNATFRSLISTQIDTDKDGWLSRFEIARVASILITRAGITDLTGIEHFISLKTLMVNDNKLTALDTTNLVSLETLYIGGNQITHLDLSHLTMLQLLSASSGKLRTLDISGCTALKYLYASQNNLYGVKLPAKADALETVFLWGNKLPHLDMTPYKAISAGGNGLQKITARAVKKKGRTYKINLKAIVGSGMVKNISFENQKWYSYTAKYKNGVITLKPRSRVKLKTIFLSYTVSTGRIGNSRMDVRLTLKTGKIKPAVARMQQSSVIIKKGGSTSLKADVYAAQATGKALKWKSSNPAVATVKKGTVTGVSNGTATITATTKTGKKVARCTVTVGTPVTGITASGQRTLRMPASTTRQLSLAQLQVAVAPANATNKELTWQSSDSSVVLVDAGGVVIANRKGTATVTARAKDGGMSCAFTITVY